MYVTILTNPIRRMMNLYGIISLNCLSSREYESFLDELHDKAVDLIFKEYGRGPIFGEPQEIMQEWLDQEKNFSPDD